jgi:hypothetical protein
VADFEEQDSDGEIWKYEPWLFNTLPVILFDFYQVQGSFNFVM